MPQPKDRHKYIVLQCSLFLLLSYPVNDNDVFKVKGKDNFFLQECTINFAFKNLLPDIVNVSVNH